MSTEQKYTDQDMIDFAKSIPLSLCAEQFFEKWKASKEKIDWEVVAYQSSSGKLFHTKDMDDRGRIWSEDKQCYIDKHNLTDKRISIHSIRRLSDGEIFSVGDRIGWIGHNKTITGFIVAEDRLQIVHEEGRLCAVKGASILKGLQKLPAPLFTTLDKVDIYPGMEFFQCVDPTTIHRFFAQYTDNPKSWEGLQLFSTLDAAKNYNVENAPCLSIKEVRDIIGSIVFDKPTTGEYILEKLSGIVKLKLS